MAAWPSGSVAGDVEIQYVLTDVHDTPCNLVVEVLVGTDAPVLANEGTNSDGVFNLAASSAGTPHKFVWASQQLGFGITHNVKLQITAFNSLTSTPVAAPTAFTVDTGVRPTRRRSSRSNQHHAWPRPTLR